MRGARKLVVAMAPRINRVRVTSKNEALLRTAAAKEFIDSLAVTR